VTDTLTLLKEFHRDKLADVLRHQANARRVAQYDINNTYQYVINREEVELSWLARAIADMGGAIDVADDTSAAGAAGTGAPFDDDARRAQAFLDKWTARVDALGHARHRSMLGVILGEVREQKRFFEQARAGRTDLLGKRTDAVGERVGQVLPTRWLE
jgi:hypothetical protein